MFINALKFLPIRREIMKKFLKTKFDLIVLALISVVFVAIAIFGMGGIGLPNTYYQTGEFQTESGYNTLVYKLDFSNESGEDFVLDSVWLNVGSLDYVAETSQVNIISGLARTKANTFRQIKSYSLNNNATESVSGKWIQIVDSIAIGSYNTYEFYSLSVSVNNVLKLNELVFVGVSGSTKVCLPAESVGAGVKTSITKSLDGSNEFAMDEVAKANANRLIDEVGKFSLDNIDNGEYKNDKTLYGAEATMIESIRNVLSGRGYYIDAVNPLGIYLMSIGTSIFGYNAFGVRVMPLIFTVATIVMLYFVGKLCFGNKWSGILFALLYAIGGYALSFATYGSVNSIALFFTVCAFYGFYKFFRKGINNQTPAKSYVNLIFAGLSFAIGVAVKSQVFFIGVALAVLFAFGMIRQYKAYANRRNVGNEDSKSLKSAYVRKMILSLVCGVCGFIVLPIVVLGVSFLAGYSAFSTLYQNTDLFGYMFAHVGNGFKTVSETSVLGWVVGYQATMLSTGKYAFGNIIITFINLFSLLYGLCHIILVLLEKKKEGIDASMRIGVIAPYIIFATMFLIGWLMNFIGGGALGGFYPASVFLTGVTVGLVNALGKENEKPLFSVKGVSFTLTKLVVTIVVTIAIVAFILAIPGLLGVSGNVNLYSWNILRGIGL